MHTVNGPPPGEWQTKGKGGRFIKWKSGKFSGRTQVEYSVNDNGIITNRLEEIDEYEDVCKMNKSRMYSDDDISDGRTYGNDISARGRTFGNVISRGRTFENDISVRGRTFENSDISVRGRTFENTSHIDDNITYNIEFDDTDIKFGTFGVTDPIDDVQSHVQHDAIEYNDYNMSDITHCMVAPIQSVK